MTAPTPKPQRAGLVERLKALSIHLRPDCELLVCEAADKIERLTEALTKIAEVTDRPKGDLPGGWSPLAVKEAHTIARAALSSLSDNGGEA